MNEKELLEKLKQRFIKNIKYHQGIDFDLVINRFNKDIISSLIYMEETGGEPDVVKYNKGIDKYIFVDTSIESPNRRSLCYDDKALELRKDNKPISSVIREVNKYNVELLSEEEYLYLQSLSDFDLKSSSWLLTPSEIRNLGGALFGSKHYNRTFIFYNSAESYYSNRGFRVKVEV